jgi:hypothetical protein
VRIHIAGYPAEVSKADGDCYRVVIYDRPAMGQVVSVSLAEAIITGDSVLSFALSRQLYPGSVVAPFKALLETLSRPGDLVAYYQAQG